MQEGANWHAGLVWPNLRFSLFHLRRFLSCFASKAAALYRSHIPSCATISVPFNSFSQATFLCTLCSFPHLSLLMDWWKCSPGALQLLVAVCCGRSLAFRCCFRLLSHCGTATDALDEMALLQVDSLADRCEVSPYIAASGTGEPLFASVWIKYQILSMASSLRQHREVGASSVRPCETL